MGDAQPIGDRLSPHPPALHLRGVWKSYGDVIANRDVDLAVEEGSVHAVLGENGAGKSTLMRVLFGVEPPDRGSVYVRGEERHFSSPRDAIACGIGMVFQHFGLVRELSALDNIALGAESLHGIRLDRETERAKLTQISSDLGLSVSWHERVGRLSVAEQQRVEILKALYREARILILDEPTALLAPQERASLFDAIRRLQAEGLSVIFITHKLDEAEALADDVTVMRAGRVVSKHRVGEVTRSQLVREMVGERAAEATYQPRARADVVLRLAGLSTALPSQRGLREVSLDIHGGEILGVVGIDGHGHQEFCQALAGARRPVAGTVSLRGMPQGGWNRARARDGGVGYVPEDRLTTGVALGHSIAENLVANRLTDRRYVRRGVVQHRAVIAHARAMIERFDIRCHDETQLAGRLSGGNIQKVVLARELSVDPDVVIVCEPTRGLDIGATANVHTQLAAAAARGSAVVVQSSDLDEVLALCDRIVVFREHRVVGDIRNDGSVTPASVGALMLGQGHRE